MVRYTFRFEDREQVFEIDPAGEADVPAPAEMPEWTRLEHHQCACCPLDPATRPMCPAAVRVGRLLETFSEGWSVEQVDVTVETPARTYRDRCDLQTGVNSMLGLQMATSGCPVLGKLRVLANFHTPFCESHEVLFRAVGAYLIRQYFVHRDGGEPDWDLAGLAALYEELADLNQHFSKRIAGVASNDAVMNAVIIFFAVSYMVSVSLEESLEGFRAFFTGESTEPPAR